MAKPYDLFPDSDGCSRLGALDWSSLVGHRQQPSDAAALPVVLPSRRGLPRQSPQIGSLNASSLCVRIAGDNGGRMSMATVPKPTPATIALEVFQNCDAS